MELVEELNVFTRCDVNTVEQAQVLWTKEDISPLCLAFCSHHSNKFGPELTAQGWIATADNRETLHKKAVGAEVC